MFFFLWIVFFILCLFLQTKWWKTKHSLYQKDHKLVHESWYKQIQHWKFGTNPSRFVKWRVSRVRYESLLLQSGRFLSLEELRSLKQLCFTSFGVIMFLFLWFGDMNMGNMFFILFCTVLIWFAPDMWLKGIAYRRQQSVGKEICYFLDLLGFVLASGVNIEQALQLVSKRVGGVLSQEMQYALCELEYGKGFETVIEELKKVSLGDEVQTFLQSLHQTKVLGVSLSKTLGVQTDLIRTQRRQQIEELVRTSSVKMSLPLVLCIFPALLLVYLGPGILIILQKG